MPCVGPTHRNGVDHTAQRATVLGLETACLDLDLVDEVHLKVLTDASLLDVRGIDAVNQVHVFRVARAIDLKAVRGALQRFLSRAGSKRDHGLEGASLRNVLQNLVLYRYRHLALGNVHLRSRCQDFHSLRHCAYLQLHFDIGETADGQLDTDLLISAESRRSHRQAVLAWGQGSNSIIAFGIRVRFPASDQRLAGNLDSCVRYVGAGRIFDGSLNSRGRFLCERARQDQERDQQNRQQQPRSFVGTKHNFAS